MPETSETGSPIAPEPKGSETSPSQEPDPEALRRQLRQLGYLSNPLERFLVGDLSRPASPLMTNLIVGVKVGVLTGLLVGTLLLVGFLLSHPDLASSPRDVAVLTAYVLGLSAGGLSLVSITVGLLMHLLARMGRRAVPVVEQIATRGAVLVSAAVLFYLGFWWRATRRGLGLISLGWADVAAAVGTLVVCGLLVVSLRAAGRGFLVRLEQRAPSPRRRPPVWRRAVLVGLAVVVFFLVGYIGVYGPAGEVPEPVEFHTSYAGARIYVVAIDGLSYAQVRQRAGWAEEGWLGSQARVAPLRVPAEMNAATLWTTVATGLPPERHGVEAFETTHITGLARYVPLRSDGAGFDEALAALLPFVGFARRTPLSSVSLTARPLWDIFSEKGLRVAVVNWWATWPAEEVRGVIISDRTFAKFDLSPQESVGETAFEAETHPAEAFDLAREVWLRRQDEETRSTGASSVGARMDRFHRAVTLELLARTGQDPWPEQFEFLALYLPGLDIAEHELLSRSAEVSAGQLKAGLDRLREATEELDGWLARLAEHSDGATVLVVGVPSRGDRAAGGQGFYALWGPDVGTALLPALDLYDLAPTLLAVMGFPVSEEMPGRAHLELFGSERVPATVETLAGYGPRRAARGAPSSALDQEYRERLRSIGYID
ncbi:MAG: alkaline phosphatase family protein [Planctomycetes bacterium]|nr:alkaline phosphatase family protein [Planctomycetota bacterium]